MNSRTNNEPISSKRNLNKAEACTYLGLGMGSMMKLCSDIGAVHRVGKRVLIDRIVIDRYLDSLQSERKE